MAYQANDNSMYDNESPLSEEEIEKEQQKQSTAKALEVGAKGAATYFGGPAAGKAVDIVAKTKAGQQVLNKGGEVLNKMPGMGKTTKALDDMGAIDAADKVVDSLGSNPSGAMSAKGMPSGTTSPKTPQMPQQNTSTPNTPQPKKSPSINIEYNKPQNKDEENEEKKSGEQEFKVSKTAKIIALIAIPILTVLVFFIVMLSSLATLFGDFGHAFGSAFFTDGETGNVDFNSKTRDEKKFYERIKKLKLEFMQDGKDLDVIKISAVYHVMNRYKTKYDYDYMTTKRLREIANSMFEENVYNEEKFKENLINKIFKKYFPREDLKTRTKYAAEVFKYIEDYKDLIKDYDNLCSNDNSCMYDVKGFNIPGKGNVKKKLNVKDLQVRLMKCGNSSDSPMNKPMIPFEEYISGVAYGELGSDAPFEAIKAQMIVARNYALSRGASTKNESGKIDKEQGTWVLEISACSSEQVYCDINQGCTLIRNNQTKINKPALPKDHILRTALNLTAGEVMVDDNDYVIATNYTSEEKQKFINLANQGYNYKQILLEVYNNESLGYEAKDINKMICNKASNANCGNAATGPYSTWKQFEGPWINVELGQSGSTIKDIGCLATSVAILIAKSGVPTNIPNFNPGTFVEYISKLGGFGTSGNFTWSHATLAAPNFKYAGSISLSGKSRNQKLNAIKDLVRRNAYIVAEVKGNTGQHWVAIDTVSGNTVLMMDPGSNSTDLWGAYDWNNTSMLAYYYVS